MCVSFAEKQAELLRRLYVVIGAVMNSRTRLIFSLGLSFAEFSAIAG